MLKTFEGVVPLVKRLAAKNYTIDNWIFKLHYRVTFMILMVSTILVCSRQYIGEHIHCIADGGVPAHVMDTYCFFTTTFTLVKDLDAKLLDMENLPHPGVGTYGINSKEEVKRHAYYQWVPFVLFGQALMFYLTHMLWKNLEGGRLKYLLDGLQLAAFAMHDKNIQISNKSLPSKQDREKKIKTIQQQFIDGIYINNSWSIKLVMCECANFFNVILQIYITDQFLSGQFLSLGADVWREGLESSVDPLDEVFPKVTKCTFHKYGPSGSIQWHDAMCVMALNVINDKIYTFLWFWFVFLFVCSSLGLIWRLVTVLLHAKSKIFNKIAFYNACPGKMSPWDVLTVTKHCSFTDWLFLKYMSKNVDGLVFKDIIISLAEEMEEESVKKPLISSGGGVSSSPVSNLQDYKIE